MNRISLRLLSFLSQRPSLQLVLISTFAMSALIILVRRIAASLCFLFFFLGAAPEIAGFVPLAKQPSKSAAARRRRQPYHSIALSEMKRPILDQIASTLFKLENDRVRKSSVADEQGRVGEPMEWSESNSLANRFSQLVQNNELGYQFKQFVADIVAGQNFDKIEVAETIDSFVDSGQVAMFSFTSCPFCRRAKDYLDSESIQYVSMELDELPDNQGNEIRAMLGRKTRRTSVPSIFVNGQYIGGCNDGPGLLPLAESGELKNILEATS